MTDPVVLPPGWTKLQAVPPVAPFAAAIGVTAAGAPSGPPVLASATPLRRMSQKELKAANKKERQAFMLELLAQDPLHGMHYYQALCKRKFGKGVPGDWMQRCLDGARDAIGAARRLRVLRGKRKSPEARDDTSPRGSPTINGIESFIDRKLDEKLAGIKTITAAIIPVDVTVEKPPRQHSPAVQRINWVAVAEAGKASGIPPRTIYRWVKREGLAARSGADGHVQVDIDTVFRLADRRIPLRAAPSKIGPAVSAVISVLESFDVETQQRILEAVALLTQKSPAP